MSIGMSFLEIYSRNWKNIPFNGPVYFNPNWQPSYYYKILKSLLLFYDQIYVWSPDVKKMIEIGGFSEQEIVNLFGDSKNSGMIVPAGREFWALNHIFKNDDYKKLEYIMKYNMNTHFIIGDDKYDVSREAAYIKIDNDDKIHTNYEKLQRLLPYEKIDEIEQGRGIDFAKEYFDGNDSKIQRFMYGCIFSYHQDLVAARHIKAKKTLINQDLINGFRQLDNYDSINVNFPGQYGGEAEECSADEIVSVARFLSGDDELTLESIIEFRKKYKEKLNNQLFGLYSNNFIKNLYNDMNKTIDKYNKLIKYGNLMISSVLPIASGAPPLIYGTSGLLVVSYVHKKIEDYLIPRYCRPLARKEILGVPHYTWDRLDNVNYEDIILEQ